MSTQVIYVVAAFAAVIVFALLAWFERGGQR